MLEVQGLGSRAEGFGFYGLGLSFLDTSSKISDFLSEGSLPKRLLKRALYL